MTEILFHVKTEWNHYFTGNPTLIQQNVYTSKQTPSDTSVHILNCLFKSITSTTAGGAVYCSSVQYLLVESSSFFSCNGNGHGGAVHFTNTNNGQCVFYGTCGYDCYTANSKYGQFVYTKIYDSISNKNYVNYSSASRCVNEYSSSYDSLSLYYGKICCPSVNVSMCKTQYYVGAYCVPFKDSNSITCSFSYSTFTDNNSTSSCCIYLAVTGSTNEIKSCNILRNTQVSINSDGTISTGGNLIIEDSCILENTVSNTFYVSSSYTITLSNCTIDNTTCSGSLIIQNTVTKSFILALNHIYTQNCNTEYDSVGSLTPIIPQCSSNKQIYCNTCKSCFYQTPPQILVFVLLYSSI
jgi:hypothetical protein